MENSKANQAESLRKELAGRERYSFSRGWWVWDRLRYRYVEGGRKDSAAFQQLEAAFRALILDWHEKLEAKGEGGHMYLYFTTRTGTRREEIIDQDGRILRRDLHGGGYHGGWGGAARMRVYEELANQGALSDSDQERFRRLVHQSMEKRFIDFKAKTQSANNHSYGNAGGVALALKLFPDAPQAEEAEAWIHRIWRHLSDFGDWKEWNYYPYGPIFLHGMLDIAEAAGRIDSDRALIQTIGDRCLGFVRAGVRGNPNCGSPTRKELPAVYEDPWNVGYYEVETSARDAHFWRRMARHFEKPEYLWAAEQVSLGGRPPDRDAPRDYEAAYRRAFGWFADRGIHPRAPSGEASVGMLSPGKHNIPERLYLSSSREPGASFASFFLYDKKEAHLDNLGGFLYEYAANGAKFLHCSGKYNNVYSGDVLRGGGAGESSLDLLVAVHKRHAFPHHPNRKGDERDPMRMGQIQLDADSPIAENNADGDAYGHFTFHRYYGADSRWTRRAMLTTEGVLIIADEYVPGASLGEAYQAGPVWHLAAEEGMRTGAQEANWFSAPALDHAWWQNAPQRVALYFHPDAGNRYGSVQQTVSQDIGGRNTAVFAYRPVSAEETARFLSVFVPFGADASDEETAAQIKTSLSESGDYAVEIGNIAARMEAGGGWSVLRK